MSLYEVLGVRPTASDDDVKAAYRKLGACGGGCPRQRGAPATAEIPPASALFGDRGALYGAELAPVPRVARHCAVTDASCSGLPCGRRPRPRLPPPPLRDTRLTARMHHPDVSDSEVRDRAAAPLLGTASELGLFRVSGAAPAAAWRPTAALADAACLGRLVAGERRVFPRRPGGVRGAGRPRAAAALRL